MRVHRGHRHPPGGPPPLSDPVSGNSRRWVVFALATVGFFISMFYRVSVAVISPDLAAQLHLDNNQLSQLSAVFFWVFAANQVPLLMTLDRLGPRLTTGLLQVAGVGGAVIFALAPTFPAALLGRALLGLGMSCNLMGPLALVANWFPVNRFGTLSGLAMVVGSLGNIAASSPLALMARHLGWRSSFLLIAALNLVWALCFVLLVRDRPPGSSGAPLKAANPLKGIGRLLTMRAYWCISLATFIRYGTYAAIQSLWAVPFLVFGLGLNAVEAGNVLLCMGIGAALAPLLMGTLSDQVLRSRRNLVVPVLFLSSLAVFSLLIWQKDVSLALVWTTFFVLGVLVQGPNMVMYAHIKELVPSSMIGSAMTAINIFTMGGAAFMTQLVGFLLAGDPSSITAPSGFAPAWWFFGGCLALAFGAYIITPDSKVLRTAVARGKEEPHV